MNNQPLISVIIPVYNVEQYLSQCLGSVINQTYPNLEIICVNDASSDGSLEILNQFAENDQRVRVIGKQNEGVSRARNVGLQSANGEYVMFVDADDWIETDTCEKAFATMHDNEADVVMWSYVSEYGASNSPKTIFPDNCVFERQEILNRLHRRFIGIVGEELEHPELADAICPVWGKLYKRSLIVQSGAAFIDLAEIGTYEDGMFNLETFFYANKVVYLNQCLYHYRRSNTASVTSAYREELFGLWQNLYQRMGHYIQEKNLPAIYNEALQNRIALGVLGLTLNISSAQKSFLEKRRELRIILKSEKYHTALTSLDISGMPKKWKLFYGIDNNIATLILKMASAVFFVALIATAINLIRVENRITRWLGEFSMEIYIVQGIFLTLFHSQLINITNQYIYILLVTGTTMGVAVLFHPVTRKIYSIARDH